MVEGRPAEILSFQEQKTGTVLPKHKKGAESNQASFRKGNGVASGDNHMIQRAHIHQRQCFLSRLVMTSSARLRVPAGMVVQASKARAAFDGENAVIR